jgi:chromate transporter
MKKYFELFLSFAKIGVLTFGGGMAMLPMLQREVVERKGWASSEELTDYFAIGQCTPGIIAVNTATFVGQKLYGVWGGLFATAGVVFPSLVIIMILAGLIQNFADLPPVAHAFAGIQVCVCVLIFNAAVKLLKKSVIDKRTGCIFAGVVFLTLFLDWSPVVFVLASGGLGILLKQWEARKT